MSIWPLLQAELQQARDELHNIKEEYEKLLRDRESDAEVVRRMLASHNSELTRAKASLEEGKFVYQSLLEDKAKLQSELINHLKLLRQRDERLGLLRRDLADSEFEVDQLRVALRCTTVYTLQLEADKQAAEALIQHVCAELDRLGTAAATALDATTGLRDLPAALPVLLTSGAMNPAAAPVSYTSSSSGYSSHRSSSSSASGSSNQEVGCCPPNKAAAAAAATTATTLDSKEAGRPRTEGRRSENSIYEDNADAVATAAAVAAVPVVAEGLLSLCDVLGRLPEQLWSVRQQLHGLVVNPEAVAAAAAMAAAVPKIATVDETAAAGARAGAHTAAAASSCAREIFNECGNGSGRSPPCELAAPRAPPPMVMGTLLQLCGVAEAKPGRTGNETLAEYDAGIGGLTDWGHRRHADTTRAEPAVLARLMMGPRGRRDGGGGEGTRTAIGAAAGASTPASVPLTPHQRPDVLAGLSDALKGWGPADGGICHTTGRRMAGAASPSPVLSLLSSPTRCSSAYMPTSPSPSPTAAATAPSYLMAVTPPFGGANNAGHLGGTGPSASASLHGCGGAGTHKAPPLKAAGTAAAAASAAQDSAPPHNILPRPQRKDLREDGKTEPQLQLAGNGHAQDARDLDSELGSLRLTNEALQRQIAELQRQNDLLQLRQLGGGTDACGDGGFGGGGGGGGGGGLLSSGFGGAPYSELFRTQPQPLLHTAHPLPSHALGSSPGSIKAAERQQHAAAAAAAATASPYNSPLSAQYYYGSLPPGQQSQTAGFGAAAPATTRPPAVAMPPHGPVAVTRPGPMPPRPGRPESVLHQTQQSTSTTNMASRTGNGFASGVALNQAAMAAGPYTATVSTSARCLQGVRGE
ncbi:hypothetical protein Vretifemale_472, partial [Volvox reticuliferus]